MIDYIQFTLTVNSGKWVIARAIAENQDIKNAVSQKNILLFGGTTVSAIAELLIGKPLRISGRISPRGTVSAYKKINEKPHTLLIHKGICYDFEKNPSRVTKILNTFGSDDFVITGANAFDRNGVAAIMAGSYGLGSRKELLAPIHTEGGNIIIAVGLEKLIPGSIIDSIGNSGHNIPSWSMGAAIGLVPIIGQLFTEIEAIYNLTGYKPVIVGRGGINGAEGSTTFILKGEKKKLDAFKKIVKWATNKKISGVEGSFPECTPGVEACKRHKACCYRSKSF